MNSSIGGIGLCFAFASCGLFLSASLFARVVITDSWIGRDDVAWVMQKMFILCMMVVCMGLYIEAVESITTWPMAAPLIGLQLISVLIVALEGIVSSK